MEMLARVLAVARVLAAALRLAALAVERRAQEQALARVVYIPAWAFLSEAASEYLQRQALAAVPV